jgi:S1-C subfamily serine protease
MALTTSARPALAAPVRAASSSRARLGSLPLRRPLAVPGPPPPAFLLHHARRATTAAFNNNRNGDNNSGTPGGLLKGVALGALGAAAIFLVAGRTPDTGRLMTTPQPTPTALSIPASSAAATSASPFVPATLESMVRGSDGTSSDRDLDPAELATVRVFRLATPSVVNVANLAAFRTGYGSADVAVAPQGTGSGFIWDKEGHIVTNFHVIRGAAAIKVALIDASVYDAVLIAGDPAKDVAVLQLQAPKAVLAQLKPVTLGSSANLQVGQRVYAIGNPYGLDHTLTEGVISGLNRELPTPDPRGVPIRGVVQVSAVIAPGSSGGVALDSKGRVVGINTAIADPSGKGVSSGTGFAIPIDTARGLVEQILLYGKVVRPVLGVSVAPPQILKQLGESGVLVLDVPAGTPAAAAGIRGTTRDAAGRLDMGDIIVSLDGKAVARQGDLFEALDARRPGDAVRVGILRGGKSLEVSVTLGGRELVKGE